MGWVAAPLWLKVRQHISWVTSQFHILDSTRPASEPVVIAYSATMFPHVVSIFCPDRWMHHSSRPAMVALLACFLQENFSSRLSLSSCGVLCYSEPILKAKQVHFFCGDQQIASASHHAVLCVTKFQWSRLVLTECCRKFLYCSCEKLIRAVRTPFF